MNNRNLILIELPLDTVEDVEQLAKEVRQLLQLGKYDATVKHLTAGSNTMLPESLLVWEDSTILFPRLLAEIVATQDKLDLPALAKSMDLTVGEIEEVLDRAQMKWERIKKEKLDAERARARGARPLKDLADELGLGRILTFARALALQARAKGYELTIENREDTAVAHLAGSGKKLP